MGVLVSILLGSILGAPSTDLAIHQKVPPVMEYKHPTAINVNARSIFLLDMPEQ
jgi:hypothetical protein